MFLGNVEHKCNSDCNFRVGPIRSSQNSVFVVCLLHSSKLPSTGTSNAVVVCGCRCHKKGVWKRFFFFVIRDNGVKYDTVNRRMEELLSSCLFLSCETSWCRNTTNLETPQTLYFQLLQGGENNSTDCGDACGAEAKFWRNLSSSNMPKPARNSFVPNSKNFICNFARVKRGQAHSSDSCQRLQCGCPKPDKW